jgi:hypothetical protein
MLALHGSRKIHHKDAPGLKTIPVTVLITTANNPPDGVPYLQMTDPVMRTIAAKAALYFWVTQGVEQIVLADATETNLLSAHEEAELDRSETRIEQINYRQDSEAIARKGKGYGEGKLIEYAINNSELLAREEYFFKCTGKVYVRNFPVFVEAIKANNISSLFWRWIHDSSLSRLDVDCRFYFTSKRFARSHLLPAYLESNDINGVFCEDRIREALDRNMQVGRSVRPLLTGYAGSTGAPYYDPSLGSLDYEFPCWVTKR